MTISDSFRRQFDYDAWANREVLAAMRKNGHDARCVQLMSHILGAGRVWIDRLRQRPQSVRVWPESDLAQCEAEAGKLGQEWEAYLVSAGDLSREISYMNSKGEAYSSRIDDVLTHVILHGAYHRGQIASHMRECGYTPACTDFIHGIRQGLVK
jgi:uncharacterized damage-inducible protein DinB